MPRQLDNTELFRKYTSIELFLPEPTAGVTTTSSGAIAKSAVSLPVTLATGFDADDDIAISGDGGWELNKIDGAATDPFALVEKALFAQAAGAQVIEMLRVPLGKTADEGFSLTPSRDLTEIFAAEDDTAIAFIDGPLSLTGAFAVHGFNPENLVLMGGYGAATVGAGTEADKYQDVLGESGRALLANMCFRMNGFRHDAKLFHLDFLNSRIQVTGTITFGRSGSATIPIGLKCSGVAMRYWTA